MEFINDFETNKNQFAKKIKESSFLEGGKIIEEKGVDDICEIIIGNNEIVYQSYEKSQKSSFITQKKLEIAENIVKNWNYSKKFKVSMIQNGFQMKNVFSSILYLNEHYKINCIIYNEDRNEYYKTSLKDYDPLYCIYKNNSWFLSNEINVDLSKVTIDVNDLDTILTMDMKDIYIFQPFLKPLAKYKLSDLEGLAEEDGVSLVTESGKKKLKKQLYDDINLKHYIQDI